MALDLAMASLVFVRSRLRKSRSGPDPQGGFACTQAVSEMLSLAGGSFDCILLSEVIEHLESPHPTTAKPRVLRPGGRLLVTTPNYRSLWPVMERAVDFLGVAPKIAGAEHITRFQPRALRQLLLEAGLGLQYFGTIHTLGPFLAIASQEWEYRRLPREIDNRFSFGMILVAVAVKP